MMSEKSSLDGQTVHSEHDFEASRPDFETTKLKEIHDRSNVSHDLPIEQALEGSLDDDPKRLRRIRRRVDVRLTCMLAVLYLWAFIDRANLGNANIAGMGKDLKLTVGTRYSIVTMIFFVGYAIVDIPSTILMKKVTASIMIPTICLLFGVITIGQGFVHHWGELALCRVLLGLFEGFFLPGSIFLLQVWYTRFEFQKRMAAYYVIGIGSSGLSGLLAYGIEKMDGTENLAGWRWIFIIEGVASCACALVAYAVLIDLPENATRRNRLGLPPFLSKEDAAVLIAHIEKDRGDAQTENFGWKEMIRHFKEWMPWEFALYVLLNNVSLYAFSFFLPLILKNGFGYSTAKANLLMFPPYAAAMVWMLAVAWFNDKFRTRGPLMMFNSILFLIGIALLGFATNTNTRYGGAFLGVIGICANVPTQFGYQHANMVGQSKRALTLGMMTMGGAFGGVISGNIFQAKDAPKYVPGLVICMVFQCITICLVCKNFVWFTYCNRKAERGEMVIQGQPGFRYTL